MGELTFTCDKCEKKVPASKIATHDCMVGETVVVPDVAGEIIGWRAWYVDRADTDEPRLRSVTRETVWPTDNWITAECHKHTVEQIPHEHCQCGLYAAKTREHLVSMRYNRYDEHENVVIGEVAMVGRVIPGTQGWRAQKARPKTIYVPYERWQLVKKLEKEYGCAVQLSNTLSIGKEKP